MDRRDSGPRNQDIDFRSHDRGRPGADYNRPGKAARPIKGCY